MSGLRVTPVATKLGDYLTLDELRNFVEACALLPGDSKVRAKAVPFKEMGNVDGQPVKLITVDTP